MRSMDIEAIAADGKGRERDYWLDKLAGELVKTGFPPDNREPNIEVDRSQRQFETFAFELPDDTAVKLLQICKNSDPRLFVVLLAGFIALLKQYTGQQDIIVGAPVLRQDVDAKFINTVLILRNRVENDMSFRDLLLIVRQNVSEATENQNYPLNILLDELNIPHPEKEFSLFNTAILLENIHDKSYIDHIPLDMIISFSRQGESIEGKVEYHNVKYRQQTIAQIISHLFNLLKVTLFNPDIRLSEINMLTDDEKHRLVYDFNNITTDYCKHKTLHRLFEEQADKNPDMLAVVYRNEQLTFSQLNKRADNMAILLKSKGVKPGTIVALLLDRSLEMIVSIMAVLKAGGAYLPISLKYPPERVKYVIEDSRAKWLLTRQQFFNLVKDLPALEIIDLSGLSSCEKEVCKENIENFHNSSDAVYIIYTSGSTGKPKGVIMEHRCVANLVAGLNDTVYKNYGKALHVCLVAPYEFDASAQQIFGALLQGHSLYIVPDEARLDGSELGNFYEKYKINISDGTPSHIRLLLEGTKEKTLNLAIKHFIIAGEAFPQKLAEEFFKRFGNTPIRVSNIYGPTETCVDSTFYHIAPGEMPPYPIIPIGKPLPNQQVYILNRESQFLPIGVPGELCIGGDGVGRGYLNQPELTSEKFIEFHQPASPLHSKLYLTGDLARWLPDGNLEFLGRKDNQVKLRGNRIELGEIENHLRNFEAVKDSVVEIRQDNAGDEQLVAYMTPDPITAITVKRILQLEKEGLRPGQQYHCLPNGMPAFYINLHEAENLYREIFEEYSYWKYGIELHDGACIFDIGANIGMFTMFIHSRCKDARIFSIEPLPPTCEILQLNTRLHNVNAKVYNIGISDSDGIETFTYFPNSPAMSGRFANLDDEIETARTFMINRELDDDKGIGLSKDQVNEIVEERLNTESYPCPVKSLSSLIRENNVDKIDLLKIDVEKGEIDVLNGIAEEDWVKIDQVVIEVHNIDDRLEGIIHRLETHGYNVFCEQDTLYKNTKLYNLYAVRKTRKKETCESTLETKKLQEKKLDQWKWATPAQLIVDLKNHLNRRLPDYMIPTGFILLDAFPLTPNGKIDRNALPRNIFRHFEAEIEAPKSDIEKKLTGIWSEILGIEKDAIGIDADFFELGGHSLKATLLVSQIYKKFNIKLPLAEVFKNSTIRNLAQHLKTISLNEFIAIEPAGKKEFYPLSSVQKRLFILNQIDLQSTAYNIPEFHMLEGELNIRNMEMAFNKLIERHESLRTSFELIDKVPLQKIHEQFDFKIEYFDLTNSEDMKILKNFIQPFDLSRAPLIRVRLIKMGENKHMLMVDMHHIVSDGFSHVILRKDFIALYRGDELPKLRLQYKDFSEWQNTQLKNGFIKKQETYWLELLAGGISELKLPTDHPRSLEQDIQGRYIQVELSKEIAEGVDQIAKKINATPYMVVLAAFNVLLSKYADQEDIIIGTVVAGRRYPDLENIIGMFANTLVLRNFAGSEKTFINFLEEVKGNSMNAFENQDYPFDELVEKLNINRTPGRNPLFDVLFSFFTADNPKGSIRDIPGLTFIPQVEIENLSAKFDLSLDITKTDNSLKVGMQCMRQLYEEATLKRMLSDYTGILETIGNNVDIKIGDIDLKSCIHFVPQYEDEESVEFNF